MTMKLPFLKKNKLFDGYILDINNAIKFKPALLTKWLRELHCK
jgi:hypothetical protein